MTVDDLELLAELTHLQRGAIVRRLKEPLTVAELADQLRVPVTRLYHHVNLLEQRGLIQVVATRRVAAVVERRYQAVARSFTLDERLFHELDGAELGHALGALFDVAKIDLQREFERGTFVGDARKEHSLLSLSEVRLPPARRAELLQHLRALLDEYRSEPDGERFHLFISAHPAE